MQLPSQEGFGSFAVTVTLSKSFFSSFLFRFLMMVGVLNHSLSGFKIILP